MNKCHRILVSCSCIGSLLAFSPLSQADDYRQQLQNEKLLKHELQRQKQYRQKQYERLVEKKAIDGATNVATGFLEVPKNMINMVNEDDSNIVYGIVGGGIRGIIDAVGRMTAGTLDVLTAPLPTKQVTYPKYVWDDFDKTTTYDKVFRLDESYKTAKPIAQPVAIVQPRLPVIENADQYSREEANRRLDTIFENEMRK